MFGHVAAKLIYNHYPIIGKCRKKINTTDGLRRTGKHWHDERNNKIIGYNYDSLEDPASHSDDGVKDYLTKLWEELDFIRGKEELN